MSLYKKHREQVKNDIVQLSLTLFREYGYENVTIEQITGKLEIAKGTFYNFFKSKKDVLIFWAQEHFASVDINSSLDGNKVCEENLRTLLTIYTSEIMSEYNLFKSFLKELNFVQTSKNEDRGSFDFSKLLSMVIINSKDSSSITRNNYELKLQVLNSVVFYELKTWLLSEKELSSLTNHLIEVMRMCLYGIIERE